MDQVSGMQQDRLLLDQTQQQAMGQMPSSQLPAGLNPVAPKKNKRVILIIAIFAVILIVLGIIYLFLNTPSKQSAGSEIYKNKQYNFSVEYPEGFKSQEYPESNKKNIVVAIYNEKEERLIFSIAVGDKKDQAFDKSYGSYNLTKQIINELENFPNGAVKETESRMLTKKGIISLDGNTGIKYEINPKRKGKGIYPSLNIAMEKNNKTYLIAAISEPNYDAVFTSTNSAIFDNFVSKLKFD
jgi:hypothetical protein